MLVNDSENADALVLETLTAAEDRSANLNELFAILIGRRRAQQQEVARPRTRGGPQPDIVRAFEALPLSDREAMALAVVEQLPYEEAAAILKLSVEAFMARLTQARAAFARLADGERHVVLRLVK
jgi:DNA-directed RNA polymerase specialized sigma24 family protein